MTYRKALLIAAATGVTAGVTSVWALYAFCRAYRIVDQHSTPVPASRSFRGNCPHVDGGAF